MRQRCASRPQSNVLTPAPVAISLRVFWQDRQARVLTGRQMNVARPRRRHRIRVGVVDVVSGQRSESDRPNLSNVPLEHQDHTELDPLIEASSVGNPYLNDIVALGQHNRNCRSLLSGGNEYRGLGLHAVAMPRVRQLRQCPQTTAWHWSGGRTDAAGSGSPCRVKGRA